VFEDVTLYSGRTYNLTGVDQAERLQGELVTVAYFPLLGVVAAAGRTFLSDEDDVAGTHGVALLATGCGSASTAVIQR
jgi:hypothetical protein